MLLNPVTSTPFSVNDILRLEREQSGPEALKLRGARRSPENSQYWRLVPEPRSEVHNSDGGGRGQRDRTQDLGPPGDPGETVAEIHAELVRMPSEWALEGRGWAGVTVITIWLVGYPCLPCSKGVAPFSLI